MTTETPTESAREVAPAVNGSGGRHARGYLELAKFLRDPLEYLTALRAGGGDIIDFQLATLPCHLVAKPEYIKLALHNDDWPPISRGRLMGLTRWYSEGLFLTYGTDHHRQRDELWKPMFEDPRILELAVERTIRRADSWPENQPINIYRELRSLVWAIDWDALTGSDLEQAPEMLEALELGVDALAWLVLPYGPRRWDWPIPQSRRTRDARRKLDELITKMIAERRSQPRGDLLTQLIEHDRSLENGSDEQIRATFKMYFGADQLHALFSWTFHLLALNPEVDSRWHEELDRVLGGRPPTAADIAELPYTRKVIMESMRIYPPVWGFFRQLTDDYRLGDKLIPKGHLMGMSPWVTHRDPLVWPDPLRFDPERWDEDATRPPATSYFPFSGGPYECHGKQLAMKEAVLIAATLGQRIRFRHAGNTNVKPTATWATEPKGGMLMNPTRRVRQS